MPSIISNAETEKALREMLKQEGFTLGPERTFGETGVDIKASRGDATLFIEVIGHKSSGPARSKDFYESFFRAVSRIKDGAKLCAIALPAKAERGLPVRARQYGEAWTRIGDAFSELEIWLVDLQNHRYRRTRWNEWVD
jgi:hypothetical protein